MRPKRQHSVKMHEGFDWASLVWHASVPAGRETCSYCRTELLLCEVPLIIWRDDGCCAELCESCSDEWLSE